VFLGWTWLYPAPLLRAKEISKTIEPAMTALASIKAGQQVLVPLTREMKSSQSLWVRLLALCFEDLGDIGFTHFRVF
jgi:hypothetical protein